MKRFWIFGTLAVVVLLTILVAFINNGDKQSNAVKLIMEMDDASAATLSEMSDNNIDFACNLLRSIYKQKQNDSSFVVSPVSVRYLLGMLNAGADGETRRQITNVIGLDGTVEEINKYFKKMMDDTSNADSTVTLQIANCIDANLAQGISIIPQYKADMMKYYYAEAGAMDFTKESLMLHVVNNWCSTHTNGMIRNILDKVSPDAAMYLLSAVYFKAPWTTKFNPKDTRGRIFTTQDGSILEHRMMHLEAQAAFGRNDLCDMLCLPYGNGGYSMYVLLPSEGKTVGEIIQNLSAEQLEGLRSQMAPHVVDILLPAFKTESETHMEQALSSMGMPLAFDRLSAEFPNIAQNHELFVSMMKQKAIIEVNEEGTKAAAATIAEMKEGGERSNNSFRFHATRPFVYYIVENSTGIIYFMGIYCGEEGFKKIDTSVKSDRGLKGLTSVTRTLKEEIFSSVERKPQFPGGEAALMKYIQTHIKYPPTAAKNNIQGKVVVQFVVEKDGSVGEVKVVRSVDKDLDNEAVRLVKTLPKFIPGRQNGQAVPVLFTLPITFKLRQDL